MWRTLALLVLLASTSLTTTHHAQACSCMPPGSDEDEAKKADAVFVGTVTSVTTTQGRSIAQIAVATAVKGVRAGATVTIDAGSAGGMCGFQFERGKRYKVFAYKNDQGVLTTSICSATRAL